MNDFLDSKGVMGRREYWGFTSKLMMALILCESFSVLLIFFKLAPVSNAVGITSILITILIYLIWATALVRRTRDCSRYPETVSDSILWSFIKLRIPIYNFYYVFIAFFERSYPENEEDVKLDSSKPFTFYVSAILHFTTILLDNMYIFGRLFGK